MLFQNNYVVNELEAYLLGFFYADGSVTGYKYGAYRVFSITLAEKDKDFLQWICNVINDDLNTKYELKYNIKTKSYKLNICKKEFIEKIINLGIIHNKTYEENDYIFLNVPNELKKHFIRGYFDGDGCICFDNKNKARINIVSLNWNLLLSIYKYIQTYFNFGQLKKDDKYLRIIFSGNRSSRIFLKWLYNDSNYYLQRKYEKYLQIPIFEKKTRYVGIIKYHNKYKVSICYENQREYLGLYDTVLECVQKYNQEAIKHNVSIQEYKGEEIYEK